MQTQLPVNQKNVAFFAGGKFFLNKLVLDVDANGLIAGDSAVERISRFSQQDLQKYVETSTGRGSEKVLFFSKDFDYRQNPDWSYIKREKTLEMESFEVLSKIYEKQEILAVNLGFREISFSKYSVEVDKLTVKTEKIGLNETNSPLRNNFLFDPFIDFEKGSRISEILLQTFEKLLENEKIPEMVIFMGEFVWVSYLGDFLESLISKSQSGFDLLLDQNGLWEAVLSEPPGESELRFLNRANFHKNLMRVEKATKNKVLEVKSANTDIPQRILNLNPKSWLYTELRSGETYKGRNYAGIIFGKEGKLRNFPFVDKIVRYRSDKIFSYVDDGLKVETTSGDELMVKVFDYSSPNPLSRIKLDVVDGEKVHKNQRLAKYHEIGGLLDKHTIAPVDGRVDLSDLKKGYIRLKEEVKVVQEKYKHYYKIRPKVILGDSWQGNLTKSGVYVSNLYKNDFELFIQKSKRVIITDSIDLELFNDIVDFELGSIITVVILGGIDVSTNSVLKFLKRDNLGVYIDSDLQEVRVGAKENTKGIILGGKEKLRTGQSVRIIDTEFWGDYATIVSSKNGEIGLKTNVHIDQISAINLI